eukprot:9053298-Lingulodinium_polyedra.AAC.1
MGGRSGRPLPRDEGHETAKLREVFKAFLREQAKHLVTRAKHGPVLRSYSVDGAPLKVKEKVVMKQGQIQVIR